MDLWWHSSQGCFFGCKKILKTKKLIHLNWDLFVIIFKAKKLIQNFHKQQDYIAAKQKNKYHQYIPHSGGRWQAKRFRKSTMPIVERLVVCLMFHGRNTGKKQLAVNIIKHAFEIIHLQTDSNPLQVLIDAITNSGAREDSTRIGSAGTVRRQAVDVSPLRRINQALYMLTTGVRFYFFKKKKKMNNSRWMDS